jgi:hypothetical protein
MADKDTHTDQDVAAEGEVVDLTQDEAVDPAEPTEEAAEEYHQMQARQLSEARKMFP